MPFVGSVYLFEKNEGGAGNWGQAQKYIPINPEEKDLLGKSVSITEDYIAAGAYGRYTSKGSTFLFFQ